MVSAYIPFYNEEKYIEKSVRSVLNQPYQDIELLLINDGSTDNSLEIVSSINDPRIRIINSEENHGTGWAKNQALLNAKGKYLVCYGGDDIVTNSVLSKQVEFLDNEPEYIAVAVNFDFIDANGDVIMDRFPSSRFTNPQYIEAAFLFTNPMVDGGSLFRREVMDTYNIYNNPRYVASQDYDFWFRCSQVGKLTGFQDIGFHYRVGHNSKAAVYAKNYIRYNNMMVNIMENIWKESGFDLTRNEIYKVYKYIFNAKPVENTEELEYMWNLLRKVNTYAQENDLKTKKEIAILCRKSFGDIMKKAHCLWDNDFVVDNHDMII